MARQEKRITACSKYDTVIEGCFQAAEGKIQGYVVLSIFLHIIANVRLKRYLNQFNLIYNLGRRPVSNRKSKGKKFHLHTYL